MESGIRVVVTTNKDRRGVFFGTLKEYDQQGNVTLLDARNAVYWSTETHGFLGLASIGPQEGSRIGPAVPELQLDGVTSIARCTPEAIALWEAGPWN